MDPQGRWERYLEYRIEYLKSKIRVTYRIQAEAEKLGNERRMESMMKMRRVLSKQLDAVHEQRYGN